MNLLTVERQIGFLNGCADVLHCDVSDSRFAPMFGLPIEFITAVRRIATVPLDVHVMVDDVEGAVNELASVGVATITVHIEGLRSAGFRLIEKIRRAEMRVGIALNPVTSIDTLRYVLPAIDKVTVLTFDPGKSGQRLVPVTLEKVSELIRIKQEKGYAFDVEVDGSCNERNFAAMRKAGADQFVVGTSGLFALDPDIERAWSLMMTYMGRES